ncbi:DUF1254 domain-containing protein [Microbacterium phyllosphaerae]|uniref:DUF1254 domain-containing protein n=1 Tax=Microbacterium phyllosphaerae TaxID=124798 RepID=UPI000EA28884|nr:DUF1254 domain-containing protein [Microbacterium phyllosphaerae]
MTELSTDPSHLTQAYLYGFPLVFNLDQVQRFVTEGVGVSPAAAFNTFGHSRQLAGPADTFVSINNDTVYSIAQIDLSVGPVLLHVPDADGRYYVFQFVDAWTNNFAYVGHRATGTGEGDFLLVPHDWTGDAPAGATVIRFPTTVGSIVGRWAVASAEELPAVHALQDATTLTPLNPDAEPIGVAPFDRRVPDDLLLLEKLRVWSQQFPPADRDLPLQQSLAPLGIAEAGASPYLDLPAETTDALAAGLDAGAATLDKVLRSGSGSPTVNGWQLTLHAFDYNLDFFEVGTIDEERFTITDPQRRIVGRAGAAKAGLWGNHSYEAAYIMTYVDDTGEQLTGSRTYTLRLHPTPPVDAFWSLTMYSMPDFYLVDNPIGRYSIGDRTAGVVYDNDGGLTITISHDRPDDATAFANWLPAPEGDFRPILRMYEPDDAVLRQEYTLPPITRT